LSSFKRAKMASVCGIFFSVGTWRPWMAGKGLGGK
jgi:hypothetical protein